jgi:hypothetical protein
MLPETDVHRIHQWARARVPEDLWPQLKIEADVHDRYVDIVEVRPPWNGVGEHLRSAVARLRHTQATGLWSIYWQDSNLKFREYRGTPPTKNVQELLDHLGSSEDPVFWG